MKHTVQSPHGWTQSCISTLDVVRRAGREGVSIRAAAKQLHTGEFRIRAVAGALKATGLLRDSPGRLVAGPPIPNEQPPDSPTTEYLALREAAVEAKQAARLARETDR